MKFGTDGIRGVANADLSAEVTLQCGRAVAIAVRQGLLGGARSRPQVVVGRDTRVSGDLLESSLTAGLCSGGADALLAGVLPTPGIAHLVADLGADAGVVLSASHNPMADNGIKVIGPGGWKLDEASESELEAIIARRGELPTGTSVGRARPIEDAEDRYVGHLVATVRTPLDGLRVVVDCAHGAAWRLAPRTLRELGVDVLPLHDTPDGEHINAGCGATHPEVAARAAAELGRIGLTLDGDADRVLAADETGRVVDGDQIIAILAQRHRSMDTLTGNAIAVTVMSNQALRRWCADVGIAIEETPVGDRHVLQAMRRRNLVLGGEQSGHVLRLDHATTGDGVLTAIGLLEAVAATGGRLDELVPFTPLPQVLLNVRVTDARAVAARDEVVAAVGRVVTELGDRGRVLVRPSGTEPLLRVMVEAPTQDEAQARAESITSAVRQEGLVTDTRTERPAGDS